MATHFEMNPTLDWKDYDCLVCEDKGFYYGGDGKAKKCYCKKL